MEHEIETQLESVMSRIPRLSDFGIGLYEERHIPKEERPALLAAEREALRKSAPAVAATVEWLRKNVAPVRKTTHSSYAVKHVVEKDIGYITNGVLIAAAVIAGYPYKVVPGSPNVSLGMSTKSLKALRLRQHRVN